MAEKSKTKHLTVMNDLNELGRVNDFLEELWEEWQLPARMKNTINLVIEEAFTNIVYYAFGDGKTHPIDVTCVLKNSTLAITIRDEGKAFNPTAVIDPDTTLSVSERPIGGLGIYLIKQFMDEVRYERVNENNHLTMILYLKQSST